MRDDIAEQTSDPRRGLADALHRHALDNPSSVIRSIGAGETGLHALSVVARPGPLETPALDFHRFNIQLSGRQQLIAFNLEGLPGAAPLVAQPGTISFVPAGRALSATTGGDDFDAFRVLISRSMMRQSLEHMSGDAVDDEDDFVSHIGAPNDRVFRLAHLLHDEYRAPGAGDKAMMRALGEALCLELARQFKADACVKPCTAALTEDERGRVFLLMEEAVEGETSLSDIANALGLEAYRFTRRFRASFGETPRRFLMRKRLERACRLLQNSDDSLADIALSCGFSSQAHMTSAFSKQLNTTPARYRAAYGGARAR